MKNIKQLEIEFFSKERFDDINQDYYRFNPPVSKTGKFTADLQMESDVWSFLANGERTKINWSKLTHLSNQMKEVLKGFIFSQINRVASSYIKSSHVELLKYLNKNEELCTLPWRWEDLNYHIGSESFLIKGRLFYCLKAFYKWGIDRGLFGFENDLYDLLSEIKLGKLNSYSKVYLRQTTIDLEKINNLRKFVSVENEKLNFISRKELTEVILLQLCLELAPRPSQIFNLNNNDLIVIDGIKEKYCTLNLPMSKKRNPIIVEKRVRKITNSLSDKIAKLIVLNQASFNIQEDGALFISERGRRMSANSIMIMISKCLKSKAGFELDESTIILRHYLAQSLADQGASAEVIAELLGHNSTLPARAYIAATPKIAEIKTKALGKSNSYKNIIEMLNTGKLISRMDVQKAKWVKGLIGTQYIGDIGSCSLEKACPKNPVFSCYTCKKFNPFKDGEHEKVLHGLEENAQFFIDTGEKKKDIQFNRTITQLEETIVAVKNIITYIKTQ
ncbi:MAG: tyrosine-type recombinase/integrase [Chitinophagaceae bacterium]|nr:tyrosine-type recombinase/integrase [Chitinophagaceae bacterium]